MPDLALSTAEAEMIALCNLLKELHSTAILESDSCNSAQLLPGDLGAEASAEKRFFRGRSQHDHSSINFDGNLP